MIDILSILKEKGLTLSTAESCTGGLIAKMITDIPGASSVFKGGVCAYANEAKERVLSVSSEYLKSYGAVSEPVALQMARGAKRVFKTDTAIATTGIAGPASDNTSKPVGLVYIAIALPRGRYIIRELHLKGTRDEIRNETAREAIKLLAEMIR